MNPVKQHYMTIYSIAYSSDGDYLIAGNNYGGIAVFNLAKAFEANFSLGCDEKLKFPLFKFEAHKFPVYSLASSKKLIFSGSTGDIIAWSWSDMKKRDSKQSWCLAIVEKNSIGQKDVNSLALSSVDDTTLYAACDDKVYGIDIKAGTILFSLSGHTDYIHCLAAMGSQECASASEDGSVRTWDARVDGSEIHIIEPYKIKGLHRSQFGKWIGCVAVNESNEWMTCGGGPMLCTWHLGTMLPATKLEKTDSITTPHVVQFCDDKIISGGPQSGTDVWAFDGKLCAEIPTSGSCIYGLSAYSTSSEKILGISGNGYKIDISRDLRISELSLMYAL